MRFNLLIQFLLLLIFSGSALACREEIQLDNPAPTTHLVIEGQISNERKIHEVRVNKSSYFTTQEAPEPVRGLQIVLRGAGVDQLLSESEAGIYHTDSMAGIPGGVYTLQVMDGDIMYEAHDTLPPLPSGFEPVRFTRHQDFLDFEYRRHQFGYALPNRWEIFILRDSIPENLKDLDPNELGQQVGIEVFPDLNYRFTYFTHPNVEVSGLMNFEVPHFYGFPAGFSVIQKKYRLSASYYRFLRALFLETEWRGTLFPTVPANIQGNFSNGALGYFSAVSTLAFRFNPE